MCESIGISTCWVGVFKKNAVNNIIFGKKGPGVHNKKIYSLIALGYNENEKGIINNFTKKVFSTKRITIKKKLTPDSLRVFPQFIWRGLELAARAPSARNRQPWYFKVSKAGGKEKCFITEIGTILPYKIIGWAYPSLDTGIAAAHFWIHLKSIEAEFQVKIKSEGSSAIWEFTVKSPNNNP